MQQEINQVNQVKQTVQNIAEQSTANVKSYVRSLPKELLVKVKDYLDDIYYNTGDHKLEDVRYDLIKDYLQDFRVGAKLRTGENRTELPFWLGSADKITPDTPEVLERWLNKNNTESYVITEKLDGVSCLYISEYGVGNDSKSTSDSQQGHSQQGHSQYRKIRLLTRGDGTVGADISYLAPYFSLPDLSGEKGLGTLVIRGELIIEKKLFDEKYKNRKVNGREYKNPRNMVSGLIGGKTAREGLSDISFVPYEIVADTGEKPSLQLEKLNNLGFETVNYKTVERKKLTVAKLKNLLSEIRDNSCFDIDGLVVYADAPYDRNTSGNPSYMFAFKMLDLEEVKETKVIDIEWNISKWGQLKPVVIVEPVLLNDITINRATAHNAKYVYENKLGPGAVIKIVRSKDVIPYIVEIVSNCEEAKMPDCKYQWDSNHVNISVVREDDEEDEIASIKLISSFFSQMGIKHVSEATVGKMYRSGLNTLLKIISADKKRLLQVPEFQEKSAERIYTNIREGLKNVKVSNLLGASGVFGAGFGIKRIDALLLDIPDLLTIYREKTKEEMLKLINEVEGFSYITSEKVYAGLKNAELFMKAISKYCTIKEEKRVSDDMKGKKYVVSGFRDKKMEQDIADRGGKVVSAISKNVSGLIVAGEEVTSKVQKAMELGIKIYTREEFSKLLG